MASANLVHAEKDANWLYGLVEVASDAPDGLDVQYPFQVALRDADGALKTNAVLKAEAVAQVKAQRDAQKTARAPVPVTGPVNV